MDQYKLSIVDLPAELMLKVLTCGRLNAMDLVNVKSTSKSFNLNKHSEIKSLVDDAALQLCTLHTIYKSLSRTKQRQLFARCKGDWKRVLNFLECIVKSWGMVKTSRGSNMQITTRKFFTMVMNNAKVYSCGSNAYGVLGHGEEITRCFGFKPIDLPFSAQVIQVSASDFNAAFLMQSGEAQAVEALKKTPCKQVAAGAFFSVFLTREGHVYTVGGNSNGQLGHGDTMDRKVPTMVEALKNIQPVVQISAGSDYVLAVTEDGSVYSFGDGSNLCLGNGDIRDNPLPQAIQAFKTKGVRIFSVSAGDEHAVAIDSSGYVYTWGRGEKGALGHDDQKDKLIPEVLLSLKKHLAVQVSARMKKTFVVVERGKVYGFGWLGRGILASKMVLNKPQVMERLTEHRILQVSTSAFHTVVITQEGRLFGFGNNQISQLGRHHSARDELEPSEMFLDS